MNYLSTRRNKTVGSGKKKYYISTAKQLGYSEKVIEKIAKATTEIEINNILIAARCE